MRGKWFPNGYVPSQIMCTLTSMEMRGCPFLTRQHDKVMWGMKLTVEREGITEIKAHDL